MKKQTDYFKKHVNFNSTTHLLIGLGLGILTARPIFTVHPVRWGVVLLVLGLAMRVKPLLINEK